LHERSAENDRRYDDRRRPGASHVAVVAPEPQETDKDSQQSKTENGSGDSGSTPEPEGQQRRDGADPNQP
jgi:hypothetical protein